MNRRIKETREIITFLAEYIRDDFYKVSAIIQSTSQWSESNPFEFYPRVQGIISILSESIPRDDGNRRHQCKPMDKLGLAWRFALMNKSVSQVSEL